MEDNLIHCHKCKKKTKNIHSNIVHTNNGLYRTAGKCSICKTNKSKFINKPIEETKPYIKKKFSKKDSIIEATEIHASVRRKFPKRKIITLGIDDLWAADLVIMSYYSNENDAYNYMLNVIYTFSKFAWAKPLTKKNGNEVSKATEEVIKDPIETGHKSPSLLHIDKRLEF